MGKRAPESGQNGQSAYYGRFVSRTTLTDARVGLISAGMDASRQCDARHAVVLVVRYGIPAAIAVMSLLALTALIGNMPQAAGIPLEFRAFRQSR